MVKNPQAKAGDTRDVGSIAGSGRSPEGGNGNPLQCSFFLYVINRSFIGSQLEQTIRTAHVQCSVHTIKAAAAAESLQSCPTLRDPRDGSPPGSPTPGILTRKIKKASLILPRGVCVSYSVMSDSLQSHGL